MFERLIRFAIDQRWLVMFATLVVVAAGLYSFKHLPIDAVPDITNVQVQINSHAPGYSPLEVEQRITFPIETAMAGLPRLEQTRSLSRYGLSQVTVVFEDGTDIYFARQRVNERLQAVRERLPAGIAAELGPISTGLGEVFMWTVKANPEARKADGTPYELTDLRELQDWVIKPQLRTVPGVAEVNSIGGFVKEYRVAPLPDRMAAYGLTLDALMHAIARNNANVGAGYIEQRGAQLLVRTPGQVTSTEDLAGIVVSVVRGVPVRVRDLAEVGIGQELRTGAASEDGEEVVVGTVLMLIGQNSRTVARTAAVKLEQVSSTLPPGVVAIPVYDRTQLVDRTIGTVTANLLEGAALVIVVLFVFLRNLRAALITACVIPLAMLFTFTGMLANDVSANLMSLGALDFGIIIDGAAVIVENCMRRLASRQASLGRLLTASERYAEVFDAAKEVRRPLILGQLIIMTVYLPIFALAGVEGKMFHPMAFTVVAALLGAMILTITFVPAAVALFVTGKAHDDRNALMRAATRIYAPLLAGSLHNRPVVVTFVCVLIVLSGLLATRMGLEFVPNLNEGDFALETLRGPGTSLTQSVAMQRQLERQIKEAFPEVERTFSRTGTAEIASDPMPPNSTDAFVMLKPEDEWPEPRRSREQLRQGIERIVSDSPGTTFEFSQPIQLRFNELVTGVRSDVAVKVFGDDMATLSASAARILAVLETVRGASETRVEQTSGLPLLTVNIDRDKASRHGLNVADIQDAVSIAIGGREAGTLFQGDRRFDIVVRMPEQLRNDPSAIERLPLALPVAATSSGGARTHFIPLAEVASIDIAPGPNQVSRENGKRRVVVTTNVRDRDIESFVSEAQRRIRAEVKLPAGYWMTWGGTFEQLQSASARLAIVVPIALLLVFVLLFAMFGNVKDGLLVFAGTPFALTGGVLALWLRGIPLSISAIVGFIALSGVAVLNGLVMLTFIKQLSDAGMPLDQAVRDGALARLRPVLMTALVASLGFVPMAVATGTGAEVQRPLATVVIGGVLSSTILTLIVLPALYQWAHRKTG